MLLSSVARNHLISGTNSPLTKSHALLYSAESSIKTEFARSSIHDLTHQPKGSLRGIKFTLPVPNSTDTPLEPKESSETSPLLNSLLCFSEQEKHITLNFPGQKAGKTIRCYKNIFAKIFFYIFGISTNITLNGKNLCLNKEDLGDYFFEIAKNSLAQYKIKNDICIHYGKEFLIYLKNRTVDLDLEKGKDLLIQDFFRHVKTNGFEKEISNFVHQRISLEKQFLQKTIVN